MEIGVVDPTTWNPSETELRITALDRAINYHQNREGDPDKVIATAATFLDFVKAGTPLPKELKA
jgi:hypothetical protein